MLKRIGPKLSIKTYLLLNKNLIHDHNGQANLKNSNGQKMNIKSGREQKPTAQAYISQTNFTKALQGALGTSLNKNEKKKRNETPLTLPFCFSYLFFTQICQPCSVFPALKIANPTTFILLSFYRAARGLPRGLDMRAAWCMTSCGRVVWSY